MIIGAEIIQYENVSSTNSIANEMIKQRVAKNGSVVTAQWQDAGRGQKGNTWESEKGMNLLMSIILFPESIKPDRQFDLSKVISLGVFDTLTTKTSDVSIKWPNDIYVRRDKIAGILIENSITGSAISSSVAGIGLNVNQESFRSDAPNPVSLKMLTGTHYNINDILTEICTNIDRRYHLLITGHRRRVANDYRSALFRYGEWALYRDVKGVFTGRIEDISDSGLLAIKKRNGRITEYAFKEVEYLL